MKILSIWIFIHISSAKVFIISGNNHSKSYSSNIGISASGDVKDIIIVEGKPEPVHLNEVKNPIVSLRPREQRNGMLGIYFNPNDPLSRLAALWWGKVFEKPFPTLVTRPASHGNGGHPRPRPQTPVTTISKPTPTPPQFTPSTIQNASTSTNETAEILPPATTETTETAEVSVPTVAVPAGPVGPINMSMSMSMMPYPPYFPMNMNPSIPMSMTMPIQMQMWPTYPLPQPGLPSPNQPMAMIMPPLSVIPYPAPPGTQFPQTQYPNQMPQRPPNLPLTPNPNPNPNPTNPVSPNQQTFPGSGSGQVQPGQQIQNPGQPNFPSGQLGGQGQPGSGSGSGSVNPPGQQNAQTQLGPSNLNQPGRPNFPNLGQFPNQPGPGQPNRPIQPGPGQSGALQPNPGKPNFQTGPSQSNFQGQMMWMQGGFPNQQGQLNPNLQNPQQQSPGYKPPQPIQPPQQNQQPGQGYPPHIKDTDQDLPNNDVENVKPPLPSPDSDVVAPAPFENIPFPILSGNHNLNLNYAHSFTYQKQSEDVRESRPFNSETSEEPPFLEDDSDLNLQKLSTTERPQLEEDNPIGERLNLTDINTDVAPLSSAGTDAPESTRNQNGEEIKISTDVQKLISLTTHQRTSSRGNFNDVRFIPLHSMLVVWRPNTSMTGNKNMFLSTNVKVPPFSGFTGNSQKY